MMKRSMVYLTLALALAIGTNAQAGSKKPAATEHGQVAATSQRGAATSEHGADNRGQVAKRSNDGHGAAKASSGKRGRGWGYQGTSGPSHWSGLSRDYHLCGAGVSQSPIDIASFSGASVEPIEFDYRLTPLKMLHNGHTVELVYAPGSGITVSGKRYQLLQLHFHMPSEHMVNGRHAAMEVHFVHRAADGELAVVGALMEAGVENMALRELWNFMPRQAGPARVEEQILVNGRDLLPHDTGYYRYMGSLTTPPCSEGVNWYVLAQPIAVSQAQIEKFAAAVGANARPTQPVNHRLVLAPSGRR